MPTETDQEIAAGKVRMRADGTLVVRNDGKDRSIGHYDGDKGHLLFETKVDSVAYYEQVTARIGTVSKGTAVSGKTIRWMGIKGEGKPPTAAMPKLPRLTPLGDAAEDRVRYYLENDFEQAKVKYGIYVDRDNKPIRRPVRRMMESTVDMRNTDDKNLPVIGDNKSQTKSPIFQRGEIIEVPDGIIARRATALTYTPNEVVGGFRIGEDGEPEDDN